MGVNAREILTGKIAMENVNQKNFSAMENVPKVFFRVIMRTYVKMKGFIGMIAVETADPNNLHAMDNVQRDSLTVGMGDVEMRGFNMIALEIVIPNLELVVDNVLRVL